MESDNDTPDLSNDLIVKLAGFADRKRLASQKKVVTSFSALVREASTSVPTAVKKLIERDLQRTFAGLPCGIQVGTSTEESTSIAHTKVREILLAFTTRSLTSRVSGSCASYTQGMNFIAAISLGVLRGNVAAAFWLFTALIEDSVGLKFYANWPPLLGLRATTQVVIQILPQICPQLSRALGDELEDFVSGYATRFMLPLGAISLSTVQLLKLWCDLLESSSHSKSADALPFRHAPLVVTLLGIFQTYEGELVQALDGVPKHEPRLGIAIQALFKRDRNLLLGCVPSDYFKQFCFETMFCSAKKFIRGTSEDEELTRCAHLPSSLVQSLHAEFEQISFSKDGIDKATLYEIVQRLSPRHSPHNDGMEAVRQLFNLLDSDGRGRLDFLQLMTGLLILCSVSREEKLHRLFDLYDTSKLNKLDKEQLRRLAMALARLKKERKPLFSSFKSEALPCSESDIELPSQEIMHRRETSPAPTKHHIESEHETNIHSLWALRPGQMLVAERYLQRMLMMDMTGNGEIYWDEFCFGFFSDPELVRCLVVFNEFLVEDSVGQELASVMPRLIAGHAMNTSGGSRLDHATCSRCSYIQCCNRECVLS